MSPTTPLSKTKCFGIWFLTLGVGIAIAFGQKEIAPIPTEALAPILEVVLLAGGALLVGSIIREKSSLLTMSASALLLGFFAGYFIPLL